MLRVAVRATRPRPDAVCGTSMSLGWFDWTARVQPSQDSGLMKKRRLFLLRTPPVLRLAALISKLLHAGYPDNLYLDGTRVTPQCYLGLSSDDEHKRYRLNHVRPLRPPAPERQLLRETNITGLRLCFISTGWRPQRWQGLHAVRGPP
jgi:hypothetical protein